MGRFWYREVDIPLDGLSSVEVERLWGRYRRCRGPVERNRLWEHYYGSAVRLGRHVRSVTGHSPEASEGDFAQWASEGLRDAIERFDPGRGFKFRTFAYRRMRGAISEGLRRWDVLGRSGRRAARACPGGRADKLGSARRFSDIVGADGSGTEPLNQVGVCGVGSGLDGSDEWEWLTRGLSRRDRLILILYYREGLTMKEIGAVIGRTESLVSQAARKARALIRERVESRV